MAVTVCDVGPRDGLQNEPDVLAPSVRAEFVNRLAAAGVPRIEAASFVRPDAVPQMARAEEVVAGIDHKEGVEYSGLALNEKGYERLVATGLDRVNFTLAATKSFSQRNANQTVAEARAAAAAVVERSTVPVTITISVAFGCPFEGRVDPGVVAELAVVFAGAEVVLADTIGVAVPRQVRELVERTGARGVHLHNTRSTGYSNARTHRARPGTSRRRISSTSSTGRGSRPASTSMCSSRRRSGWKACSAAVSRDRCIAPVHGPALERQGVRGT